MTYVGPAADVIRRMGSKIESRSAMAEAGVPIVPGTDGGSSDPGEILNAARSVGVPLFVKASAGGGGKGLRLVTSEADLEAAIRTAIGEAKAAFGDGTVYVEKRIENPRHIEFQILADTHGNTVHLFERECSIQRRHQKVVEEAPSPALTPELREEMGRAAVAAAQAVGYTNAGTIEFMLDREDNFYFLEMNTRIQVEHPVTEMTTGVDLVQWQLRIARGEKLAFTQDDLMQRGHAIECRVYAEDETKNFMPSCGVISYLYEPSGPGVRNDSGVYEGWEVSPHYDPILSKLVTYGETREVARQRMLRALDEYVVHGVQTSIDLHRRILCHPLFVEGRLDTNFIDDNAEDLLEPGTTPVPDEVFIAAALYDQVGLGTTAGERRRAVHSTVWEEIGHWEIGRGL
jgi:acetyl-CoA carboxylase biotin carboxylase subunit